MSAAPLWTSGGLIVEFNPDPPPEVAQLFEEAQKQSEADKRWAANLMKHKVVNSTPGPDDPKLEPEDRERLQFAEFCRGAAIDCAPYAERLLELCTLGAIALSSQDGNLSPNSAQSILEELALCVPPVLEQLVVVERDLALLGWATLKLYATKPSEEVKALQERLQLSCQDVVALPTYWVDSKLRSAQSAVDELGQLLRDARGWYQRDCELFEAAAKDRTNVSPEQVNWLKNIQSRTAMRVETVDQVLRGLDNQIRPCLDSLASALEQPDASKAPRAVSRS